jgi:hypothetical protein
MKKLLRTIKPLVTDDEYKHSVSVVSEFESGLGRQLQGYLEERARTSRNWLEEWWEKMIYLLPRYPIAGM